MSIVDRISDQQYNTESRRQQQSEGGSCGYVGMSVCVCVTACDCVCVSECEFPHLVDFLVSLVEAIIEQ